MSSPDRKVYDANPNECGIWQVDIKTGNLNRAFLSIVEEKNPIKKNWRRMTGITGSFYGLTYVSLYGLEAQVYWPAIHKMVETVADGNFDPIAIVHGVIMCGYAVSVPVAMQYLVVPVVDRLAERVRKDIWNEEQKALGLG